MTRPLNVIALSGSTFLPSRTRELAQALVDALAERLPVRGRVIHLGDIARVTGAAFSRSELTAEVEAELCAIEAADVLIVATPVYRGALPGQLKHVLDLLGQDALVIDHQLRPLFSFFQAVTLPIGVYAADADFVDYRVHAEALHARIALAVTRALPLLAGAARGLAEVPARKVA
jgi:FMN reductase